MKISNISTYIMKIMRFGFKKFVRVVSNAESQDLEWSWAYTGGEKAGWFTRSQERKYTKLS